MKIAKNQIEIPLWIDVVSKYDKRAVSLCVNTGTVTSVGSQDFTMFDAHFVMNICKSS